MHVSLLQSVVPTFRGDHHCPCSQKIQNPLPEWLPLGSTHLHQLLWAVSKNIHHLLPPRLIGPTSVRIQTKQIYRRRHLPNPPHCPLPLGPEERVRMLFTDHSSAFNTIVPSKLVIEHRPWAQYRPLWLDSELPDKQTPGSADRQHHILHPDSQHRHPSGLHAQSSPVLPVHTWLRGHPQIYTYIYLSIYVDRYICVCVCVCVCVWCKCNVYIIVY